MNKKLDILVEQTETYSAALAKELTFAKAHAMAAQGQEFAPTGEDEGDPKEEGDAKAREVRARERAQMERAKTVDVRALSPSTYLSHDPKYERIQVCYILLFASHSHRNSPASLRSFTICHYAFLRLLLGYRSGPR